MAKVDVDPGKANDYLVTSATMISVAAKDKRNAMTATRFIVVSAQPPLVAVGIAADRFTHDLIEEAGEFVVNLPAGDQAELAANIGKVHGHNIDKLAELAVPTRPGTKVKSPLIDGCAVTMECKLVQSILLGDRTLFVGEVLAMQVDEEKLPAARLRGKFCDLSLRG